MSGYSPGKGVERPKATGPPCPGCGKPGHGEEGCWKLHPELTPANLRKKAQGVEGEETDLGVISLCVVEIVLPKKQSITKN